MKFFCYFFYVSESSKYRTRMVKKKKNAIVQVLINIEKIQRMDKKIYNHIDRPKKTEKSL